MKRKIALQFRNALLSATIVVLFLGYALQVVSNTPKLGFQIETKVMAEEPEYGIISASALSVSHAQVERDELEKAIENIDIDSKKVESVRTYLSRRGAPLASKAEYLVKTAKLFNIDYRLVAAISVIESGGGKHAYRPYNAWGWGGAKGYTFSSWEDGIYTVSKGLSRYYASGATTPAAIAPRYNPHTPNEWARKVQNVMNQM